MEIRVKVHTEGWPVFEEVAEGFREVEHDNVSAAFVERVHFGLKLGVVQAGFCVE